MNKLERIRRILSDSFGERDVTPATSLRDLGLDSLEIADLLLDVESEFGVRISDIGKIQTVGDILEHL